MQITCPRCLAAYDVPSAAFPSEGRKLRCSSCHFVWMALPDGTAAPMPPAADPHFTAPSAAPAPEPEPDSGDDFSSLLARAGRPQDTTPRALSPEDAAALARAASALGEQPNNPATKAATAVKPIKAKKDKGPKKPLPNWLYASGGVVVMLAVALILLRMPLAKMSPALTSVYEALGFTVETPSDIFSFTGINATREDQEGEVVFTVTGQVTNLSKRTHDLPQIRVMWLTPKGTVGPYTVTDATKPTLAAGESTAFTAQLKGVDTRAGGSVKVVFLDPEQVLPNSPPPVTRKKAAADTPATPEADKPAAAEAHPSADTPAPLHEAPAENAAPTAHEMPPTPPAAAPTATPSHNEQVTPHDPAPSDTTSPSSHEAPAGHSH